jgi:hypothetical protein
MCSSRLRRTVPSQNQKTKEDEAAITAIDVNVW